MRWRRSTTAASNGCRRSLVLTVRRPPLPAWHFHCIRWHRVLRWTRCLTPKSLAFAAEFPAATREQWLKLVDGVLKGAPFDKRLVARTYDGLAIQPLYARAADARPVAARAPGAPWTVMQRVDHPDPAAANEQALHDLENGATGLTLVCRARSTPTATASTAPPKRSSACSTASISMPASPSTSTSAPRRATPRSISPRW